MLQPTRLISTPFAQEGEKTEIQNVTGEFDNSATYRLGFPSLTMQSIRLGGKPPKGTDFNGVLFDITENISFLCKGGRYQYNAGLSTLIGGYPEGSNLLLDDNVTEVVSTVAGNQNNPNINMTGWVLKPNRTTAANVADASGETQQQVNYNGGSKWHSRVGGYLENERVILTNGDIVKSTIGGNTNDPNVDMVGWVKTNAVSQIFDESGLSQQEINDTVKSEMPFSTHTYTTLQAANDSTSGNILHLEKKPYTNSVDLDKNSIQGSGYETVLNVETGNYAIKVKQSLPNWDKLRISDLTIGGLTRVNTTGVLFDPADAVAGRRNLEYVSLNNLDIAIHKPTGNIGNTYSNVNAYNCNYVIKANSVWTPQEMHSGNDTWRDFQVDHIDKWAFDYTDLTGGGAIHIKDGIIEYCDGGGIRIEYSDDYPPFIPPRISNVWFEQVAKASSVVRDGVPEVPRNIKLVNTAMCIIENCKLDNIELVNSTAVAVNCRANSTNITLDSTSNLIIENAFLHGSVPSNVTVSSIAKQSYPTHFGANLTLKGNAITGTVRKPAGSSIGVGVTFRGNIGKKWAIDGSALAYADTISDNGVICSELALNAGQNYVFPYITTPSEQWVVWGISAKQVGGLSGSFRFSMDYNLGDIILRDGEWNHSFGIAKTPSAPMNIRAILSPTTSGTIRIRDYFIVAFKSESEAVAFVNSRTAVNTYPELIQYSFTGTVAANSTTSVNVDFLGASLGDTFGCAMNSYTAGIRVHAETSEQNVVKLHIENTTTNSITLTSALANIQMLT